VGTNDVSTLVQTALSERPELLSLRSSHDAESRFAKAQRDARLPTIAVVGAAGGAPAHDSHLPDDYAAGGIQLSVPLFEGGLYLARQHEAELQAQSDSEILRAAENNVVHDVHIAWLDLNTAQDQLRTTEELVTNASEAYQLADARYRIGSSSIVELSQAQLGLTSAQIAEASARYNVLVQQSRLSYEIGGLH
jgi:outer membrane protein